MTLNVEEKIIRGMHWNWIIKFENKEINNTEKQRKRAG
jgi:hypothetical protein